VVVVSKIRFAAPVLLRAAELEDSGLRLSGSEWAGYLVVAVLRLELAWTDGLLAELLDT
jgi:hypothetical protein